MDQRIDPPDPPHPWSIQISLPQRLPFFREIFNRHFDKDKIELVIDDRPSVIRMWQRNGLRVLDVGDGQEC